MNAPAAAQKLCDRRSGRSLIATELMDGHGIDHLTETANFLA